MSKHSLVYVTGQALSRAVGFFMIPVYTRYIAPTNFGAMDLIQILSGMIGFVISLGVAESMSRHYYAEKDETARKTVVSTIIIGFAAISVPIVILFMFTAGLLAKPFLEGGEYRLYLQMSIATTWFALLAQIGFTYLRMRYMAKLFVMLSTVQLVIALSLNIYFIVFLGWEIFGVFLSALISQAVVGIAMAAGILAKLGLRLSPGLLARLVWFGAPLVPAQIANTLGFVSNRLFLRWLGASDPALALAQIGIFSLGHKFGVIVNRFVNVPFNSFWRPRRLQLIAEDAPGTKETMARICTYAVSGTTYLALLLSVGVESVIQIVADPRYYDAHRVVPFIALTYVLLGLEPHLTTGILHRGKTTSLTVIGMVSLAVAILWNFVMIPRFGLLGAATSNLAAMIVRETLIYKVVQRVHPIPIELRRIALMLTTACGLYLLCLFIRFPSPYLTFVARVSVAATFPIILFGVRFYRTEEIRFVRRLFRKRQAAMAQLANGR